MYSAHEPVCLVSQASQQCLALVAHSDYFWQEQADRVGWLRCERGTGGREREEREGGTEREEVDGRVEWQGCMSGH